MTKAERLKIFIESKNLTQRELSEAIGVTPAQVSKYTTGYNDITRTMALVIECKYGLSADWLLNGSGEMYQLTQENFRDKAAMRLVNIYETVGTEERKIIETAVDMAEYKNKERLEKMKKGRGQSSAS